MNTIGIKPDEQYNLLKIVAAILHLGNIQFSFNDKTNSSSIANESVLKLACDLIQVDASAIAKTMLTRNITAARESYTVQLTREQAESARDALSMLLYSRMFDYIVKRINDNICANKYQSFIGVLDIYGFESFTVNSFEQFCINWANEKLQQQYNQHVFKLSQQDYIKENISWSMIEFNDNQACLDLIETLPLSIINILDEECKFPKVNNSNNN